MAKSGLLGTLGQFNQDPLGTLGLGPSNPAVQDVPAEGDTTDTWHPHTPTILGALADAFLVSRGMKPAFAENRDQANLEEAMQGLEQNPARAINRMAQVNPTAAWKMYNDYVDNQRLQGNLDRQNKLYDLKLEEIVRDRVAGMAGAATPETWPTIRSRMEQYARAKGFDDIADTLPQDYNKVDLDAIRYGEVPVKAQEQLKQGEEKIQQGDRRLDQGDRRLDQGDARLTETNRHDMATEGQAAINEAGRNSRHDTPSAKPQARNVMTKYGVGQVSKDGTKMLIHNGGKYYLYLNAGSNNGQTNWVPQGEVQPK